MSKTRFEMLLMPKGQASYSNELQMLRFQETTTLCFFNYIIKLSNIHTPLRRHFKDDGRINHIFSSKILHSLWKVAAWKLHSAIQKLNLMRKLQIFIISWKTYTN